jgi:hypothetical protein
MLNLLYRCLRLQQTREPEVLQQRYQLMVTELALIIYVGAGVLCTYLFGFNLISAGIALLAGFLVNNVVIQMYLFNKINTLFSYISISYTYYSAIRRLGLDCEIPTTMFPSNIDLSRIPQHLGITYHDIISNPECELTDAQLKERCEIYTQFLKMSASPIYSNMRKLDAQFGFSWQRYFNSL